MATASTEPTESSDNTLPECLVFPARKEHTATVIISHGLGDSAKNFAYFLNDLKDHPDLGHVKFILPSAPIMSVTGMRGRSIPSWFNIYSFNYVNRSEDEVGLFRSVGWLKQLITNEETQHSIPSNRIVIGGLSQGGAISILTTLTIEKPLAGLFALSTYIPLRQKFPEASIIHPIIYPCPTSNYGRNIPILWCHGTGDQQVICKDWKQLAKTLAGQLSIPFVTSDHPQEFPTEDRGTNSKDSDGASQDKARLHFRSYEGMGHCTEESELLEVAGWIARRIPGEA
ncbi:hypothetical protein CVT25_011226 [Psilocybe cyanescens]|uniref:Acyl-protein thioesterase 1 n=1 Tax=Psilocybe cyanescens TaxID=93625 RepID=A0A409XCI5_PSICY|nr:hypothetical protein CVT25_011226 [Psilocybe cyanescens]